MTGLNYVKKQPSIAGLAKTKADIVKKSSYSYSSLHHNPLITTLENIPYMRTYFFLIKLLEKYTNHLL